MAKAKAAKPGTKEYLIESLKSLGFEVTEENIKKLKRTDKRKLVDDGDSAADLLEVAHNSNNQSEIVSEYQCGECKSKIEKNQGSCPGCGQSLYWGNL